MIRSQLAIARFMLRSKNSLLMRYVWLLRVVRRASESAARIEEKGVMVGSRLVACLAV